MQRALSGVLAHASIVGHGLLLITPARRIARIAPAAVACGVQDAWAAPRLLGLALRMRAGDGHPRVEHADAVVAAVAAGMGLAPLVWSVTCISPASPHSTLPMPALPASASARVPRVEVMPQRTARTEMPMCYALAALELAVECGHIHIARHLAPKAYPLRPRIATAVRSSNSDMLRFVAGLHPRHIVFDGGELEQCVALGRNTQIIWLVEHTNWVFDSRGDGVASVDAGAAGASLALGNEDGAGGSAEQASVAGAQLVREMQIMCARHGNVELLAYMAQIEPVCVLAVEVAVASGCQPVLSWLREHLGVCAPSAQCSE
nr:hypothetical protein HK105_004384 [Polyrhizophydium stewartii]